MLFHTKLPLSFWAEAVKCATYVRNRSPTTALPDKTPYKCWFGQKPDLSNLRVFGCISYVHVPNELRKKLHPKSVKCIFAGYPDDTKGFRLFNLETRRFVRSRSVLFCEEEFSKLDVKIEANTYINLFPSDEIEDAVNDENGNDLPEDDILEDIPHPEEDPQQQNIDAVNINAPQKETYENRFLNDIQNISQKRSRICQFYC